MTDVNPTADRLVTEARQRRDAKAALPRRIALIGFVFGAAGLATAALVPLFGWLGGLISLVAGSATARKGETGKLPKIAMIVGGAAILLGAFRYNWIVAGL